MQFSRSLRDQQDSTNRIALIVRGEKFEPYINGDAHMSVTHAKQPQGQIALQTWQESGTTTCTFSNGWLWVLD